MFRIEFAYGSLNVPEKDLKGTYFEKYLEGSSYESKSKSVEMRGFSVETGRLYFALKAAEDSARWRFGRGEPYDPLLNGRVEILLKTPPEKADDLGEFANYCQDADIFLAYECYLAFLRGSIPETYRTMSEEALSELSRWWATGGPKKTQMGLDFVQYVSETLGVGKAPWLLFVEWETLEVLEFIPTWGLEYVKSCKLADSLSVADIRRMPNLRSLDVYITDFDALCKVFAETPLIESLHIESNIPFEKKALEFLRNIKDFDYCGNGIFTADVLPCPEKLESLTLTHMRTDSSIFEHLPALKSLTIYENLDVRNSHITELSLFTMADGVHDFPRTLKRLSLYDLSGLEHVRFTGVENVKTLAVGDPIDFSQFTGVEELCLVEFEDFPNVEMPGVKTLKLLRCKLGPDLCEYFPNVETLILDRVRNRVHLEGLRSLNTLTIKGAPDISDLEHLHLKRFMWDKHPELFPELAFDPISVDVWNR